MKTVQREPRLTGSVDSSAAAANSPMPSSSADAKLSRKEPQPAEQASFSMRLSMAPPRILMHFISCPPISRMKSTSGINLEAAL
ncbi:hypothetical protein D3C86_2155750 [compost metagenome]